MKEFSKFIRLFDVSIISGEKWFQTSSLYEEFHDSFLTKDKVDPTDLWIVYESFGNHCGYITEYTKYDYGKIKVLSDIIVNDETVSKSFLEDLLEKIEGTDVSLLTEFKKRNDLYQDPKNEWHAEYYQVDLDNRIKAYLKNNSIEDSIFTFIAGHRLHARY